MDPTDLCDIILFFRLVLICVEILRRSQGRPVPNQALSTYEEVTGQLSPAQRYQLHFEVSRVVFSMRNVLSPVFPSLCILSENVPLSLPRYPLFTAQRAVVSPNRSAHLTSTTSTTNHSQASTSSGTVKTNADSDTDDEQPAYNPALEHLPPKKRFHKE